MTPQIKEEVPIVQITEEEFPANECKEETPIAQIKEEVPIVCIKEEEFPANECKEETPKAQIKEEVPTNECPPQIKAEIISLNNYDFENIFNCNYDEVDASYKDIKAFLNCLNY